MSSDSTAVSIDLVILKASSATHTSVVPRHVDDKLYRVVDYQLEDITVRSVAYVRSTNYKDYFYLP